MCGQASPHGRAHPGFVARLTTRKRDRNGGARYRRRHVGRPSLRPMTTASGRRRPLLLVMAGLPGTGKSICADRIANHLRAPVIDKDELLEHLRRSRIAHELASDGRRRARR